MVVLGEQEWYMLLELIVLTVLLIGARYLLPVQLDELRGEGAEGPPIGLAVDVLRVDISVVSSVEDGDSDIDSE